MKVLIRRFSVVLALMLLHGCGVLAKTGDSPKVLPINARQTGHGVFRLTRDLFEQARSATREPFVIPLDSHWIYEEPTKVRAEEGRLFVTVDRFRPYISLPVDFDAEDFNELRVRMKVDRGSELRFKWMNKISSPETYVSHPIVADNEFHTYTVSLRPLTEFAWRGRTTKIGLSPSDESAVAEITEIVLGFRAPERPRYATIRSQTHETLMGNHGPWELTVPPEAVFDVYVGVGREAVQQAPTDGARFRVYLENASGRNVIVDKSLSRKVINRADESWIHIQADLSAFAGQDVRFLLEVDDLERVGEQYPYWGNPMVFSRKRDPATIPVVLISCDALRADHLSCYGYSRETTPHLDKWAEETVLFENAIVQETYTLPSHATMFTGLYPKHHGATANANLAEEIETLAEVMADADYLTAAFMGARLWFFPWRGMAQGFDMFNLPRRREIIRDVFATHRLASAWLEYHSVPNLFLVLHNMDMHAKPSNGAYQFPYGPSDPAYLFFANSFDPAPTFKREGQDSLLGWAFLHAASAGEITLTEEEAEYCVALYDDCVRSVDLGIFQFFEELRTRGLYDKALIIVTADHGEELQDRGNWGHGTIYEECCRVPLMIKFPGGRFGGRRVSDVVQLTDLYPTILDVLGLPGHDTRDGQSLLALLEARTPPRELAYAQRYFQQIVRSNEWKLIRDIVTNEFTLYNLVTDPLERRPVHGTALPIVQLLKEELETFYQISPEGWHLTIFSPYEERDAELLLTTNDRFETSRFVFADRDNDKQVMVQNDRMLKINLGKIRKDELRFRTLAPQARVMLSIRSERDFSITLGNNESVITNTYYAVLDPADREYPPPSTTSATKPSLPTMSVWYIEPTLRRTPTKALTPQEVEELKALGYLD